MTGEAQASVWTLPKFTFQVRFGSSSADCFFQEVSGLEAKTRVIEYRAGNNPAFSTVKIPGLAKVGNVTLKKGLVPRNATFLNGYSTGGLNRIQPTTVVIMLCDESGNATMTWTLANAWPVKVQSTDLGADSNEVAVEMLELAYETLTIQHKK